MIDHKNLDTHKLNVPIPDIRSSSLLAEMMLGLPLLHKAESKEHMAPVKIHYFLWYF